MTNVIGLDLSLRATGMVCVPSDWGLDWSRIAVDKAGASLPKDACEHDRTRRVTDIVDQVVAFVACHNAKTAVLEQYAFSATTAGAHALGELGGAVRVALYRAGIAIEVVSPAAARKLLGRQPRKHAKVWAAGRLYAAGAPTTWTGDQIDAFACANSWLAANGGFALIIPEAA